MPTYTYERLSAQDSSFLVFESPTTHMHVGGLAIFEAGPLTTARGRLDIDRIRRHIAWRLHLVPRYRQRLAFVPIYNQAGLGRRRRTSTCTTTCATPRCRVRATTHQLKHLIGPDHVAAARPRQAALGVVDDRGLEHGASR